MGKKLLAAGQLADALSHFHAAIGTYLRKVTLALKHLWVRVFFPTVCFVTYCAFLQTAFHESHKLGHLYAAVWMGANRNAVEYLCFDFDKRNHSINYMICEH